MENTTCPPSSALRASAPEPNGMKLKSAPSSFSSCSPTRWSSAPMPPMPTLIGPGVALMCASASSNVFSSLSMRTLKVERTPTMLPIYSNWSIDGRARARQSVRHEVGHVGHADRVAVRGGLREFRDADAGRRARHGDGHERRAVAEAGFDVRGPGADADVGAAARRVRVDDGDRPLRIFRRGSAGRDRGEGDDDRAQSFHGILLPSS